MTKYSNKVFSGETPSIEEWNEHLKAMHRLAPSQTPHVFESPRTERGLNSYQMLLTAIAFKNQNKNQRILDLACGDGHLVPYIQESLGSSASVVGIDMSEDELSIAKSKNFSGDATFKCEMANSISEKNESFDAVLCHMAFMLMNPIEPIINEIVRVLKPNGVFAAVVGGGVAKNNFLGIVQSKVSTFMKEHFPKFIYAHGGDLRVRNVAGIEEIFSGPCFQNLKITEFSIFLETTPEETWSFFKDWYNISLIPEPERSHLQEVIVSTARIESAGRDQISFDFPMRLISVEKNRSKVIS